MAGLQIESKVFASAGEPVDLTWTCDAEAAKYPAPLLRLGHAALVPFFEMTFEGICHHYSGLKTELANETAHEQPVPKAGF